MDKWHGRIVELDLQEEAFTAELVPMQPGSPTVLADFPLGLLAPDDDVAVGDGVYVTVRTVLRGRYPEATASVRLRRLGEWTELELAAVRDRAKEERAALAQFIR